METKEFKSGNIVEHINKESKSSYPHDKRYMIFDLCRMKNPTTGEWVDGVMYMEFTEINTIGSKIFVREKEDFYKQFKLVE